MQMPKEINSKTELFRGFHFEDLIFILMYVLTLYLFQGLIHPMLVLFYNIYNTVIAVWLFAPSKSPNRKIFHLLLFRLQKMRGNNRYLSQPRRKEEISYE